MDKRTDQVQHGRKCYSLPAVLRLLAIEAAMAFPASWNPLVKSNANAVTTTRAKGTTEGLQGLILVSGILRCRDQTSTRMWVHPDLVVDATIT